MIVSAACVFAARGYHGASTQNIADRLGMRQASLYYYFATKEAALEEVCAKGTAGFLERARSIQTGDGTAAVRLRRLLEAHVAPLANRSDYMVTFLNERKWFPRDSRRRIAGISRQIETVFEEVIHEGIAAGEFRADLDPRLAALGFLGMMNAVAAWHGREAAPIDKIAAMLSGIALNGVLSAVD